MENIACTTLTYRGNRRRNNNFKIKRTFYCLLEFDKIGEIGYIINNEYNCEKEEVKVLEKLRKKFFLQLDAATSELGNCIWQDALLNN